MSEHTSGGQVGRKGAAPGGRESRNCEHIENPTDTLVLIDTCCRGYPTYLILCQYGITDTGHQHHGDQEWDQCLGGHGCGGSDRTEWLEGKERRYEGR